MKYHKKLSETQKEAWINGDVCMYLLGRHITKMTVLLNLQI